MSINKLHLTKIHDHCGTNTPTLTVIMIHGIASDSSTYDSALKYLEAATSLKSVRFVTFDLLGSGKSFKDDKLNYDYHDQLEALHNSIESLNYATPLVLIGHSLGTFIVTRYAATYKNSIKHLVLVSPPIYTPKDLVNPAFAAGMDVFIKTVSIKKNNITQEKSFKNSMTKIVLNETNYETLAELTTPTTLIYGDADQLIASHNIPKLLKDNPKYITAIKTIGRHGVTHDKFTKIKKILEEELDAETL